MTRKSNGKKKTTQFQKGHTANKGKDAPDPIRDYLMTKLDPDFPVKLIERLSKGLRSKDSKIFLDTFKAVVKHIPEPAAPVTTSPVVEALISKHLDDVSSDIELLEDRSTPGAREMEAENKYKDQR